MNLIDCVVVEVLGKPIEKYGKYWVHVRYNAWGTESTTDIMCNTLQEAEEIDIDYKFLS